MNDCVVVCFCYAGDELALPSFLRGVRRVSGAPVMLVDDPDNQCSADFVSKVKELINVFYSVGDFPRGGTLNGAECVQGIVRTLRQACVTHDARCAVKVDADVLITSLDWVTSGARYIGFEGGHACRPSGMIYAIHRPLLDDLCKEVDVWRWQSMPALTPEDATIGSLSSMLCDRGQYVIYPWSGGRYIANMTVEKLATPAAVRPRVAVHFGQREVVESYPCQRGVYLQRVMSAWLRASK